MQCPRSVEGLRQQGEIRPGEFLSPPEQVHGDKEISIVKKRRPGFRHRDRIRHGGDNRYGEDADRKIGGPRYLLAVEVISAIARGSPSKKRILEVATRSAARSLWRCLYGRFNRRLNRSNASI